MPSETQDAPRRCFICLTDEDPSDPPGSWVDPCGCTLEAHQDCMLSWVTDCERSNKPLQCPVCKDRIQLEGLWDPIVAMTDAVANKFTRASPFMLLSSVTLGVQFSLQMYGAFAMWAFSGREALVDYVLGHEIWVHGEASRILMSGGERLGNALVLTNVGPALLVGQLMPWFGNKIFLSTASLYGVYHVMHDDTFLTWPPSPQLAMAVFPYVRSAYLNLWREFVFPYEVNLNRQIMGLPPVEPRRDQPPANERQPEQRNGEGGVVGFLNGLIEALEGDDIDEDGQDDAGAGGQDADGEQGGGVVIELVIEEVDRDDQEGFDVRPAGQNEMAPQGPVDDVPAPRPTGEEVQGAVDEPHNPARVPEEPAQGVDAVPAVVPDAGNGDQAARQNQHEAPQAPPARRPGLGTILSGVSNAIVSALILPGVSFAMGELLRLALPKQWTAASSFPRGSTMRPGLLQQQWGRSLVGGCLYVVLKDFLRLYTKYRKVAAIDSQEVYILMASSHNSKQRLALAICDFLSASTNDGTLTADDKDSIDVAINCIAESFKVDPSDTSAVQAAIGSQNLLQIYSVFEKARADKPAAAAPTPAPVELTDEQKKEAEALKSKGNAAMAQKDYRAAIDFYTQALAINANNAVYLSNRAAAHSANKDHASARSDAEAAVAIDPAYTKAWSRLGLARFALGDARGAMEAYDRGIQHEGNGGSDAMKKGYETAKRRVQEMEAEEDSLPRASPSAGGDLGAGGMPDLGNLASMFGGGGAGGQGGGMPDLGSIMSNPMFANMAQKLMSNPDLMNNLMSNPRLREMADRYSTGGGMPDLNSLMSDPQIGEMARNMMGGGGNPFGGAGGPGAGAGGANGQGGSQQ
ncbi:RING finger domain-containing protein [Fusarium napiforme]|uniref:RING finger domain-containing protein n=1 Tax=Fusarium napiforme TaxID=42672 RepID=A0A8H5MXD7_9HYPO|nr:RING finger domain-containing protein [Fusarium napiforme]